MTRGLRGLFVNHACPLNEIRDRWATLDTPGSSWRVDVRGLACFAYRRARRRILSACAWLLDNGRHGPAFYLDSWCTTLLCASHCA